MPVVSFTLEEVNKTILTHVYFKIIEDVTNVLKIPYGTLVVLHKDTETTLTDNRTNVSTQSINNLPSTVANRRVIASLTEEYSESSLTTTAVHQASAYPIFKDTTISVSVYPIYIKSDLSIEFSYISHSKSEAIRIRDDLRIRLSQMANIYIHEIDYTVLLPEIVEEFIADVHELKSRLHPQTLKAYFEEHSTNRIFPVTDLSNESNARLGIFEKQVRIVGLFDLNPLPEKLEMDNDNNNYKFSFSYKLSIDVPRAMVLRYPVMIANRPLPSKYLSFIEDFKRNSKEEHKKQLGYTSGALRDLSIFEAHRQLENRVDINLPINIPLFDDFATREGHKGYSIILSILTDVNETDRKSLFNLNELEDYYIPEPILEYYRTTGLSKLTTPYKSFLYIGLWQEGKYFDADVLTIDRNLNISSKVPLSLLKPVRVTISFCTNISGLSSDYLQKLRHDAPTYLSFINEHIEISNNFKTEISSNYLDNTLYREIIEAMQFFSDTGKHLYIRELLAIVTKDKIAERNILSSLYTGHNRLYRKIVAEIGPIMNVSNFTVLPEIVTRPRITQVEIDEQRAVSSSIPDIYPLPIANDLSTREQIPTDIELVKRDSISNIRPERDVVENTAMKTVMYSSVFAIRKNTN